MSWRLTTPTSFSWSSHTITRDFRWSRMSRATSSESSLVRQAITSLLMKADTSSSAERLPVLVADRHEADALVAHQLCALDHRVGLAAALRVAHQLFHLHGSLLRRRRLGYAKLGAATPQEAAMQVEELMSDAKCC